MNDGAVRLLEHFDVVEDIRSRIVTGCIDPPTDAFALSNWKKLSAHSVVVAVTSGHAADRLWSRRKPYSWPVNWQP